MKAMLLIAAAFIGTTAVAQTTPAPGDANTMPSAAPAMSDTSTGMASNAQAVPTDTSNYPVCSRTVTDKCVQRGAAHKAHRNP